MDSTSNEFKPKIGMIFNSLDEAWKFWIEYGGKIEFGVRKHYFNKNKNTGVITSAKYVFCKESVRKEDKRDSSTRNPRLETRTNCKVRLGVTFVDNKYKVNEFIEEHNHLLHLQETVHMLASQRKVTEVQSYEIDLAEEVGLKHKSSFQLMSRHAGGINGLGYTMLDAKNYIRSKRQKNMVYGEVGCLMRYFQQQLSKNPSFYHANQMDVEEQITNVFWVDARMIIDYEYFQQQLSSQVSTFNHHRGSVIFGAALLYDETASSFEWLFKTFLEAHKQKKPLTIFTDQDQAMEKALQEVMPEIFHGLCTWHLMQNGIKHLENLMKDRSHFLTDFKRCMYGIDDETQFEEARSILLAQYNVHENTWLQSTYNIKEKWAACYMKKFLDEKRYNELRCEFETRQKLPRLKLESSPMLRQLSEIYTPTIFNLFQMEFVLFAAAYIKFKNETQPLFEYVVGLIDKEGEWRVTFNPSTKMISCICRKFEMTGLLCCHAVKVYDVLDVKKLPEDYILNRWTRKSRSGVVHDYMGNEVDEDPKRQSSERYRKLCMMLIRLATEASVHPSTFSLVHNSVCDLTKKVMEMRLTRLSQDNNDSVRASLTGPSVIQAKGFKKRIGVKTSRRLKSWVELQAKRRKISSRVKDVGTHDELYVPCSAPSVPQACLQTTGSQFNFTKLLMAQLDHPQNSLEPMDFNGDISNTCP
ncbi:protein FAR1-RELATED SEQUENCE 5-like [Henckelia pumila]|uniref:protein FAR1-RELATED SEQUENCE 5-like n=1 Tax=Henckelia pumila TaxID=405737 RepID=UPI003C6E94CF